MFVGHFAVAFGAKRAAPRSSLGTLVAAATFVDLVWPVFVLLGVEHMRVDPGNTRVTPLDFAHYPWTHSALAVAVWSVAFGAAVFARTKYARGAVVTGIAVFSHWLLDLLSHRPDLPLWPAGPKVGLGLWSSLPSTLVVELSFLAVGLALYVATTRPVRASGRWAFVGLVALLLVIYFGSLFGPPPPSAGVVAAAGLLAWLFVPWAVWIDRGRRLRA